MVKDVKHFHVYLYGRKFLLRTDHDLNVVHEGQYLKQGDPIWFHDPQRKQGLTPKLQRPWQGPYVITKKINDLVHRIQLNPRSKPKVVHRNRLWLYTGANAPTWFQNKAENVSKESIAEMAQAAAPTEPENTSIECEHDQNTMPNISQGTPSPLRSGRNRHPPQFYHA